MRTKFRLFATLLMVTLCAGFISCSSDNDEEKQADKTLILLVGSWEHTSSGYTEVLTFNTDKTWTGIDYNSGAIKEQWGKGTYSYNSTTKELTLNNDIFESDIVKISKITDTELSYISGDGIMNYTRKK